MSGPDLGALSELHPQRVLLRWGKTSTMPPRTGELAALRHAMDQAVAPQRYSDVAVDQAVAPASARSKA